MMHHMIEGVIFSKEAKVDKLIEYIDQIRKRIDNKIIRIKEKKRWIRSTKNNDVEMWIWNPEYEMEIVMDY